MYRDVSAKTLNYLLMLKIYTKKPRKINLPNKKKNSLKNWNLYFDFFFNKKKLKLLASSVGRIRRPD